MAAVIAVVVIVMTLENAPRLTADLQRADAPARLLARLSIDLIPEHLAIALPIATLLAVALTVRTLAGRGEWQMLAAAGMSPARRMAAPMALATLAAAAMLGNGLVLRPLGERNLDALYLELVAGGHGVAVPLREPVPLDATTTLIAEDAGEAPGTLQGVLIRRGATTMAAETARVVADGRGGIALLLGPGVSVERRTDGSARRVHFRRLTLRGRPPIIDLVPGNLRHRLDRLGGIALATLVRETAATPVREAAFAALSARVDAAWFCLLLPWIAVAVGVPPRRQAGGAAMLVGILLIVLHLETTALVEDHLASHALIATLVHVLGWTGIAAAIVRLVDRHGDGAIDLAIGRMVRAARGLRPCWPILSNRRTPLPAAG